jgi:hypothetical protein
MEKRRQCGMGESGVPLRQKERSASICKWQAIYLQWLKYPVCLLCTWQKRHVSHLWLDLEVQKRHCGCRQSPLCSAPLLSGIFFSTLSFHGCPGMHLQCVPAKGKVGEEGLSFCPSHYRCVTCSHAREAEKTMIWQKETVVLWLLSTNSISINLISPNWIFINLVEFNRGG